jgi:adenosylcobinamide-GDP ribazoletransferase
MIGLRAAFTFLTRVPLQSTDGGDGDLARAVAWFPVVCGLLGLTVAGAYALSYPWLPSFLGAVVAVAVGTWLTGAFHEDGLADTLDAFGSGATGEEALRIMRDPRLGTYGTMAIVFSVLWRIVALGSLSPAQALAGLVTAHSLARAGSVVLMSVALPARADGLGRTAAGDISTRGVVIAVSTASLASFLVAGWWAVPALALVGAAVLVLRVTSMRRLGGVTGDVLGACEQVGEMLVIALVAGAAWAGWSPWWAV